VKHHLHCEFFLADASVIPCRDHAMLVACAILGRTTHIEIVLVVLSCPSRGSAIAEILDFLPKKFQCKRPLSMDEPKVGDR
jgi:hypothetical protein